MANRKFNWVSSSGQNNLAVLTELNNRMLHFYSALESRNGYQLMVDNNDNDCNNPGLVTAGFIDQLKRLAPVKVLEVGCGSGRIYQFIENYFENIEYTGIEVSENIIEKNRSRFPEASWVVGDAYHIPMADASVDVCFSFYVLEHLVFPEKGLNEMMRVIKNEGSLILIFPDFVASGRLASQSIGLSNAPTATAKLKKGKFIDALISLYDSRVRLPRALKNASVKYGSFPVNMSPKCLSDQQMIMMPDVDAVYIASKREVERWAMQKGYGVTYPEGKENDFAEHSFLSIQKLIP
jgi:SAM-dependent methyltransferase